jgi:hypothetical protein
MPAKPDILASPNWRMDCSIVLLSSSFSKNIYRSFNFEFDEEIMASRRFLIWTHTKRLSRFSQFEPKLWFSCWKLLQSCGKHVNFMWNKFPTRIKPPHLFICEDHGQLWDSYFQSSKTCLLTFYLQTLDLPTPLLSSTSLNKIWQHSRWPCWY